MKDLHLDWCSHKAAKYACERWHYSGSMPMSKVLKIGVWEFDEFIGCVLYSRGANNKIGEPYGLDQTEVCELTRIALDDHETPVTQIMAISRKLLTDKSPGIDLIVSYADPQQEHLGTIYQADNWIYVGTSNAQRNVIIDGDEHHKRTVSEQYGTASVQQLNERYTNKSFEWTDKRFKYKYLYPLDDDLRPKLEGLAKPYP